MSDGGRQYGGVCQDHLLNLLRNLKPIVENPNLSLINQLFHFLIKKLVINSGNLYPPTMGRVLDNWEEKEEELSCMQADLFKYKCRIAFISSHLGIRILPKTGRL